MIDLTWRRAIPWSLVLLRLVLGPMLLLAIWHFKHPQTILGASIVVGFLTDVFDGILARRWKTETPLLRIADSAVDMAFYLSILAVIIIRHRQVIYDRIWLLTLLLAFEFGRILFDWLKYRRMASYHSYASKLWGILLAITTIALLCFDRGFQLVTLALAWGIICNMEGITMSVLLPEWTYNVKTLPRAMALRRQIMATRTANTTKA